MVAWAEMWPPAGRRWRALGLVVLAAVPVTMAMAASPAKYPPIDATTGGPTGASLLGSTLGVVLLLLLLPRVPALPRRRSGGPGPVVGVALVGRTTGLRHRRGEWWKPP